MYIKRENYLSKIRRQYDLDLIKVLTGVRRSGKSVILSQIRDEILQRGVPADHLIEINFEDERFDKIKTHQKLNAYVLSRIKDKEKHYLFLDEIQHVREFEKALSSLKATENVSIFVTGSNSRVSGSIAASPAGSFSSASFG